MADDDTRQKLLEEIRSRLRDINSRRSEGPTDAGYEPSPIEVAREMVAESRQILEELLAR